MKKHLLCFFILLIDVVALAQLPPYQRNPVTTNPPAAMSNAITAAVMPAFVLSCKYIELTNQLSFFGNPTIPIDLSNSVGGLVISSPNAATSQFRLTPYQNDIYLQNTSTGRIVFGGKNGVSASGNIILDTGANTGVGVTAPTHKLHVAGDVRANGALFLYSSGKPVTNVSSAVIYAKTNAGIVELYARGSDGVETQISPHADDAPEALYDRGVGMKEMIWREESQFVTNGMVSFINLRRMARITELNTKAILYLLGNVTSSTSNSMQRLKDMSPAQRQVIMSETFSEYNLRTSSNLMPVTWEDNEQSRQVAYDLERSTALSVSNSVFAANAELASAGKTNFSPYPYVPPQADIRRTKPNWLK